MIGHTLQNEQVKPNGRGNLCSFDNHYQEYTKPDSPLYGGDEFQPRKIVSDSRGNVYILNNGSKGLMQFSNSGEFFGYFGTNIIAPSFRTVLQYTFFTII